MFAFLFIFFLFDCLYPCIFNYCNKILFFFSPEFYIVRLEIDKGDFCITSTNLCSFRLEGRRVCKALKWIRKTGTRVRDRDVYFSSRATGRIRRILTSFDFFFLSRVWLRGPRWGRKNSFCQNKFKCRFTDKKSTDFGGRYIKIRFFILYK